MTRINQFESAFLSADKAVYHYARPSIDQVLLVSDLDTDAAAALLEHVRRFLSVVDSDETTWSLLDADAFDTVKQLLDSIAERAPDLIVTYRHLHSTAWQWPHSLGEYLDVLTQATDVPVVVLPHPDANRALPHALQNTDRVMAITDHLTGDDRLINHALRFTQREGSCWLTHVEPQPAFDRYLGAIAKIPEIDTDTARELIERQLLKDPRDYIFSCRKSIAEQSLPVVIEAIVTMGRRLSEYQRLIDEHDIDLLVFNTLDDGQLAMHGLAYPLAVELRQIPLLML
jgi:hypothetical protein